MGRLCGPNVSGKIVPGPRGQAREMFSMWCQVAVAVEGGGNKAAYGSRMQRLGRGIGSHLLGAVPVSPIGQVFQCAVTNSSVWSSVV